MSRWRTLVLAAPLASVIGSAVPHYDADAAFVIFNNDGFNIYDAFGRRLLLGYNGSCFYYVDTTNFHVWVTFTGFIVYFTSDVSGTTVPIVMGNLYNTTTGEISDGGFTVEASYPSRFWLVADPNCRLF